MRGRKPKPTTPKKLHRSRVPINAREPRPEGDLSVTVDTAPEHFDDDQRGVWNYALANAPAGMLKLIDSSILECWVVAHCMHRMAVKALRVDGTLLVTTPNTAQLVQSPYVPIINRQAQIMMRAASELGFSPTARPRVDLTLGGGELSRSTHGTPAGSQESIDSYLARAPKPPSVH